MSDTKLREKADALIAFTQQGPRFIAWVEAVTDSIAPEPEKVAKVETMADRIAADLKAGTFRGEQPAPPASEKAAKAAKVEKSRWIEDGWGNTWEEYERENCALEIVRPGKVQCVTCESMPDEPTPPEPAARELPEAVRRALIVMRSRDSGDLWFAADALETFWRAHHAQPVAVGMSGALERVLQCAKIDANSDRMRGHEQSAENTMGAIREVRQQAAQGRKVELPKVREYFDQLRKLPQYHNEQGRNFLEGIYAELDAAEGKDEGRR